MNYYVCHYAPQGNINGEPVYSGSTAGNTQSQAVPATTPPATTNSASTSAPTSTTPTADTSAQSTGSQDQFITDSLDAHNNERNAYGVPPLTWSDSLAQTAQAYAQVQAATGTT
ncbi:CAP domain-containing protein, partial [Salmonella enterica subsp. enterica serovar 1,4,[5],12:i:-]|nr:CAP domain-containing protein [Salmonella enterica subsp. enterica serovar 1,4,[5],12:i:-]